MSAAPARLGGRAGRVAALVVVVALAAALAWWASRATLLPRSDTADAQAGPVTAEVTESSVGRSLPVNVTLVQPVEVLATNLLPGVVTAAAGDGARQVGDELYAVAGTSVRVVTGDVPFYRDLTEGLAGTDVRQLQDALVSLGHLAEADGRYGAATVRAVRAWQRSTGAAETGRVALGTLVAVPVLPAELRLGEDVRRGALLAGGEDAVLGATGSRDFRVVLSTEQAALVTQDTPMEVLYESHTWPAVAVSSSTDADGSTVLALAAPGGGEVCADACAQLPGGERVSLRARAMIVPETSGPTVPAAALRTATDGSTYARLADGTTVPVTALASAQGLAVVAGLDVGQVVLLDEAPAGAAPDDDEPTDAGGAG